MQYPTIPLWLEKVGLSILKRNSSSLIETDVNSLRVWMDGWMDGKEKRCLSMFNRIYLPMKKGHSAILNKGDTADTGNQWLHGSIKTGTEQSGIRRSCQGLGIGGRDRGLLQG